MLRSRSEIRRQIESTAYDVCVIGGGATGAGCALDAQLRGLRTVLVEAGDFASRTSSASTKMAHGGIRYLEAAFRHLDVRQYRLVRDALGERALMLRNAPHLAAPLEILVPCSTRLQQLYYGAGLKLYDRFAGEASLARSRMLPAAEALRRLPALHGGLRGAVSYADGQFDDARYALALVMTFIDAGGHALNYARVAGFEKTAGGAIAAAFVEDQASGETFTVRARAFVNATGPYSDAIRRLAEPASTPRLFPSKGVHLLFPLDGWGADGLLVPQTEDGRLVFALPYNGRLLVGTTDDAASPDAGMAVERPEIEYLIRQINPYLARPLAAQEMVSGFAGLRPLVRARRSRHTSRLIRDDEIEVGRPSGLVSILGGKWTTYRLMAEKTIDRVQAELGLRTGGCVTRTTPLAGSKGFSVSCWQRLMDRYGVAEPAARHLARKFGAAADAVLQLAENSPDLRLPLVEGAAPIRAEVVYAARYELALTVEDVLARRTGLELYDWRLALQAAEPAARLMAREFGWSAAETAAAAERYTSRVRYFLQSAGLPPDCNPSRIL